MTRLICSIALAFVSLGAQGQKHRALYNTSVQANGTLFYFNKMAYAFSTQAGFNVNRVVYEKISVGAGYQFWPYSGYRESARQGDFTQFEGQLFGREKFSFFDLYGRYGLSFLRHKIYGNLGLSYAKGINWYITDVVAVPGYHDVGIHVDPFPTNHLGGIISVGYDFLFIKKHVSLGTSATVRYYGSTYQQYELNLNLGYHFNLFKQKKKAEN